MEDGWKGGCGYNRVGARRNMAENGDEWMIDQNWKEGCNSGSHATNMPLI